LTGGNELPARTPEAPLKRRLTRRQFLVSTGKAGVVGAVATGLPVQILSAPDVSAATSNVLSKSDQRTLRAAVARIVPAEQPGDWTAADVGADAYILGLLAGVRRIYAGGPIRRRFARFQPLSRVKRIGWGREVRRLRKVYRRGLRDLDARAGGDFASIPAEAQDAILTALDYQDDAFFGTLVDHTIEGVYSHPVYGGNKEFTAWNAFGYEGDVHGVRFPRIGPTDAPWNEYGGYAPEEMAKPGKGPAWFGES
jgi:gluconate 2-dehydrogenase gamma chain